MLRLAAVRAAALPRAADYDTGPASDGSPGRSSAGVLVAPAGRGRGYLQIRRPPARSGSGRRGAASASARRWRTSIRSCAGRAGSRGSGPSSTPRPSCGSTCSSPAATCARWSAATCRRCAPEREAAYRETARLAAAPSSSSAARIASSSGIGLTSNSSIPEGSLTTVSVARPPRPAASPRSASTGVTRPIHLRGQERGQKGHRQLRGRPASPIARASASIMPAVGGDVRAADLDLAAPAPPCPRPGPGTAITSRDRDRLGAGRGPAGGDHHRQPLDEEEGGPIRLAAGADHGRGAEIGHGDAGRARGSPAVAWRLSRCLEPPSESPPR